MDGVFLRKKKNIWLILMLMCGVFLIGLCGFLKFTGEDDPGTLQVLLIMGILCGLVAVPSMLLNHGAFIHIGVNSIKAKYHWFGRLDCRIADVAFVLPRINTLTILLKSGKRHVIMGVENSWDLSSAIRRQGFALEAETPTSIRRKLTQAQDARKKALWWVLGLGALMFANIFIAVLLTGGKDLHEFSQWDWILFSLMGLLELLTVIGLFCAAQRCGKYQLPIEQLKYRLRGAVIAKTPLPTNNAVAVYTEWDHLGRIVVCGFPNDESVYYVVQKVLGDFKLETVHESEIYPSKDDLPTGGLDALVNVTDLF